MHMATEAVAFGYQFATILSDPVTGTGPWPNYMYVLG